MLKNIPILMFVISLLAGCADTKKLDLSNLSQKGAILGAVSVNGHICFGTLVVKKIINKSTMQLEPTMSMLVSTPKLSLSLLMSFNNVSSDAVYLEQGDYAATAINCRQSMGNTTYYYTHSLASGGAIAHFNVRVGEIVDIGMLNLTTEHQNFIFFQKFKRFSQRSVASTPSSILFGFLEQNPALKDKIVTRHMAAVPVPPLPSNPEQQPE